MIPRRAEMPCVGEARRAARRGPAGTSSASTTQNDWKFVCAVRPGRATGRRPGTSASSSLVARGQLAAPAHDRVELAELHQADRGLDVGHPVVEADLEVLSSDRLPLRVALGGADAHAVLAQPAQPRAPSSASAVVSMPPSPVVMHLAGVERPRGQLGAGADRRAAVASTRPRTRRPRRRRCPAGRTARGSACDVGGHAALVDDDDRPGRGGAAPPRRSSGVRLPVPRVDVGEHRGGADVAHAFAVAMNEKRRDDDLVARADAEHDAARGAARSCSDETATPCAAPTRAAKRRLELGDPGPWATQPERTAVGGGLGLLRAEPGLHHRDRS